MIDPLLFFPATLILLGLVTLIVALGIFNRSAEAVKWCGALMVAAANWALAYGIQLLSTDDAAVHFWVAIQYLSIASIPSLWIIFCLKFTGRDSWLKTAYIPGFFLVPAITFFLHIFNSYHHLHYLSVEISQNGPLRQMKIQPGVWYFVHAGYFYSLLCWGFFLIASAYRQSNKLYKKQYATIMAGALLPCIANIIYLSGIRPYQIDITSYFFVVTVLCIYYGLTRLKLFNIIPVGFSKAVEQMSDGLIILNKDGLVSHINNATISLFQPLDVKIGEHITASLSSQDLLNIIKQHAIGRTEIQFERNGALLSYEASVTPIYNENKVNGSIIIIRNMTAEKAAENQLVLQAQQLQELNHLKDKLFTVIAHDLRSPFAGMKSALELTETGVIEKDEFFELIPQLLKQVKEVSGLLDNLFSWSSMQLAGKDFKKDTIKLLDFTKRTLEVFRARAEAKGISLEYEITPELEIKFDVGSLELIYRNLISNAIKFCSSGDIITVMAEQSGDKIILFFVDSGVGIPEHIQTQLFTSIGTTTPGTHMERGSGFGLAICHEYAVKNGATLTVKSEVGTGSIFSLEVPINNLAKKGDDCQEPECLSI